MKTLKNKYNGKLERVKDKEAESKVKFGWDYTSKTEWKNATRQPKIQTNVESTNESKTRTKTSK
jgi:hypothetical protein